MLDISDNIRRILIVDDCRPIHDDFRKILCAQIPNVELDSVESSIFGDVNVKRTPCTYEIESAYQGQQASKMMAESVMSQRPFDLAFVDMRMPPGWDGVETIEKLWEIDAELQVVICTAYSDYSWPDISRRLGYSANMLFLRKPFDNLEVSQLAAALTQKRHLARLTKYKHDEMEHLIEQRTHELGNKESALRQKQKLESVGLMAGGIAHEFNNLLQVICGRVQLAKEQMDTRQQPHQDLEEALCAARQASEIAKQLFAFSRPKPMEPEFVVVSELVDRVVQMIQPFFGERIRIEVGDIDARATVLADRTLMHQVLMNLCINARDAMPTGGCIHIDVRVVDVTDLTITNHARIRRNLPAGLYTAIRVSDTGCGIPPNLRERIFDPFFTTKEFGTGTGLGLATVHGIVKQHRGWIEFESEMTVGTTFIIFLPLVDTPLTKAIDIQEEHISVSGETILIAEDDPAVRGVMQRILEGVGYRTLLATDGDEAVKLYFTHRAGISLVILDVVLPKRSGREVYQAIKNDNSGMAVLLCTACDPKKTEIDFLPSHDSLLEKPFGCGELLRRVQQAITTSEMTFVLAQG